MKTTIALLVAAALAGCSSTHAEPTSPPGVGGQGNQSLDTDADPAPHEPVRPSAFFIWPDAGEARQWIAAHPRSRLCLYETPDGPATGSCKSIHLPVSSYAMAKELSGPRYLGAKFDCLEYIPATGKLQTCDPEGAAIPKPRPKPVKIAMR